MKRRAFCLGLLLAVSGCMDPAQSRYRHGGFVSNREAHDESGPRGCSPRALETPLETDLQLPTRIRAELRAQASYGAGGLDGSLRVDVEAVGGTAPPAHVGLARDAAMIPTPGFAFGVDLRAYRSVAFVIDSTYSTCHRLRGGRDLLGVMSDHVAAAISGLAPDTRLDVFAVGGNTRHLEPAPTDAGRRAAMQWACALQCVWDGSVAEALRRAIARDPEVVVVLSDGGPAFEADQYLKVMPARFTDATIFQDPVASIDGPVAPLVVAIQVTGGVADPGWMRALADKAGGLHVARVAR